VYFYLEKSLSRDAKARCGSKGRRGVWSISPIQSTDTIAVIVDQVAQPSLIDCSVEVATSSS
jgi:hypothetical protein